MKLGAPNKNRAKAPPRCRCQARLTAAGACPYGCPKVTPSQAAVELETKLRERERDAGAPMGMSMASVRAGARQACSGAPPAPVPTTSTTTAPARPQAPPRALVPMW